MRVVSRRGLVARVLAAKDRERWGSLVSYAGAIFQSLRWTDLLGPSVRCVGLYEQDGTLRGGFLIGEETHAGVKVLRNPPFTPAVGPFFERKASNAAARTDEERAAVGAVVEYLSRSGAAVVSLGLSPGITDCLPFYWRGWKVVPHVTYRIDLTQDECVLLAGMSPERRKNVRKAQNDGVSVTEVLDTSAIRALAIETFARHGNSAPSGMDNVLSGLPPGENSYCLIASLAGRPIAGVYVVHDRETAYYLIGGYSENGHHGAGALAMWEAILRAKALGLAVFDFEGSMIPAIERYFRGFGGVLTPVFGVHRAWLPLESLLKLRYRNRF